MANKNRRLIVAAIGDSMTAGFHVDSNWKMFLQLWLGAKKSWFSRVVRKIKEKRNVSDFNYSTPSSKVIENRWLDRLVNFKSMKSQIDELLKARKFPDMIFIWAGHSVLDWSIKSEQDFTKITKQFHNDFQMQLERLCEAAVLQEHNVVIIVFRFINIRTLFHLRTMIAEKKKSSPKLFPYFEKSYKIFKRKIKARLFGCAVLCQYGFS